MADIVLTTVPSEIRWSPNHGGPRARTLGVFIHSTRGGAVGPNGSKPTSGDALIAVLEKEYQNTLNYVDSPNASQVGPTWVVGPKRAARCITDANICWCQTIDNDEFLSIEVVQPAYLPPFVEFQYKAAAEICARYAKKYGVPIRNIGKVYTPSVQVPGIIGHDQSRAGYSRGKTDPGYRWDWNKFIQLTQATYNALFLPPPTPPATETSKLEAAYALGGPNLGPWLKAHPEYGVPRYPFYTDPQKGEHVYCTRTAKHPLGVLASYRPYLKTIGKDPFGVTYD